MRQELQQLMDKFALKFDQHGTHEDIVLGELLINGLLSKNEHATVVREYLPCDKIKTIFNCLKTKDEKVVFDALMSMCLKYQWNDLANNIEQDIADCLTKIGYTSEVSGDNDLDTSLQPVRHNLVNYLKDDVEIIFKYWDKLGASRGDSFENFYNGNIVIKEKRGKTLFDMFDITSFEKLFENKKFKRIIVTAPAGYGKSTFVHEMVRKWVYGSKSESKFRFVFLLRLGEIKYDETVKFTLRDLFEKCLVENNAAILMQQTKKDHQLCSDMLFVFDGFDEMNDSLISKDVMNIILGKSNMKPYVVVTSRPEKCVDKIKGECNVYIELKGFTEMGSNEQLEKFYVSHLLNNIDKDILKVPLFCTLVSLLQQNSEACIDHHYQLIEKTLDYMINRYKIVHTDFSDNDRKELFLQLGRYELSYTHDSPIPQKIINTAINANLIMPTSSENEIYFPHRMFADYFAAFCVSHSNSGVVCEIVHNDYVGDYLCVNSLQLQPHSWFVYFLSYFNEQFKLDLWTLFGTLAIVSIPLFDEYDTLPSLKIVASSLEFDNTMPTNLTSSAAKKLSVPSEISIHFAMLAGGFEFKNKSDIREVTFFMCDIIASGAELLKSFNHVTSMSFCTSYILGANKSGEIKSVDHTTATANATFFPTLFDFSESLVKILINDTIGNFYWIKDLNRIDIHAYLTLTENGVKKQFSDLRKLEKIFQDCKDQSELCTLYLTRGIHIL